jgi:hypothetical protein
MNSGDEFFFNNIMCSSDDEDFVVATMVVSEHIARQRLRFRGSILGHAPALNRNRESGHCLLFVDYFQCTSPLFNPKLFRRRFRMTRHVFNRIQEGVMAYDDYFSCKEEALGKVGFSSY